LLNCSVVNDIQFKGLNFHVFRDDLYELSPGERALSGNKARKLYHYFMNDFPSITNIVCYGSAQSNMLFSLSRLAQIKGWEFEFFVDHVPKHLFKNPRGNYALALKNGAKIKKVNANQIQSLVEETAGGKPHTLYIPQGGRHADSEYGIAMLAKDIESWVEISDLANPHLMLASGSGTMAFYLQKHLPFKVMTCPCVGSSDYLRNQFFQLESINKEHPLVLETSRKYHFGKLYPEFLQIWQELKMATQIEFDLVYDPLGWLCMIDFAKTNSKVDLIYLHQGGQVGNQTMLERYQRRAEILK